MTGTPANGAVTVTHADNNGTWLVELRGEHDLSTAPRLDEQTRDVWPRRKLAIVDLRSAAFIDSTVVSWLLSADNAITTAGTGTLIIIEGAADSVPARVLRLLHLREVLACYPTRHDAQTHHPGVQAERLASTDERTRTRPGDAPGRTRNPPAPRYRDRHARRALGRPRRRKAA